MIYGGILTSESYLTVTDNDLQKKRSLRHGIKKQISNMDIFVR